MTTPVFLARVKLPDAPGCEEAEIVLRDMGLDAHQRYVTHQHNMRHGNYDGFYWGHYFTDLEQARTDFVERCRQKGAL
jgi:hypothetical protein